MSRNSPYYSIPPYLPGSAPRVVGDCPTAMSDRAILRRVGAPEHHRHLRAAFEWPAAGACCAREDLGCASCGAQRRVGTGSKAARLPYVLAEPGHGGRLVAVDEPVVRPIVSATTRIDDALPVAGQHLVGDRPGLDPRRAAERRNRRRDTVQPVGATLLTSMAPSGRASIRGRGRG